MNALHDEPSDPQDVTGEAFFSPRFFREIRDVTLDPYAATVTWSQPDLVMRLLKLDGMQPYRTLTAQRPGWGATASQRRRFNDHQDDAKQVLRAELELSRMLESLDSQTLIDQIAAIADGLPPDASCFSREELELVDSLKEQSDFFGIVRENMPGLPFWERITSYEAAHEDSEARSRDVPSAINVDVSVDYL